MVAALGALRLGVVLHRRVGVEQTFDSAQREATMLTGELLDRAIDAAMKEPQ